MTNDANLPPAPSTRLTKIGFGLTITYLGAFAYFSFHHASSFDKLGPDQWANFFAGSFAPLAFLWLVLGFLQQGHELRQSARALWLQSEELRNSVEQQRALVEATREQIDFDQRLLEHNRAEQERRRQPQLRAQSSGGMTSGDAVTRNVQVENYGATCTNVVLEIRRDGASMGTARHPELPKGASVIVQFSLTRDIDINNIVLSCRYVDQENVEGFAEFVIVNKAVEGDFFSFTLSPLESG